MPTLTPRIPGRLARRPAGRTLAGRTLASCTRRTRRALTTTALSALTAMTSLAGATGCARNPVTGQRELALVSEQQEIAMGQQAAQEVGQTIGLIKDDALQQYVQKVGASLAAESERPGLPWTFRVVDDPTPNAFALPGGFIFVTRGLMDLMNSEAELATVIGHEIGHVTARHSVQQISRAQLAQLGLGLGAVLSPTLARYGDLVGSGLQLLFLKYGRDDERQADELGFKYALQENYDVREMADVFAALQRESAAAGQSPLPTWLASHPDPGERIKNTERRLAALNRPLGNALSNERQYMQHVEGLVYGVNPRQGFFKGSSFIHPDLRFRLDFPSGWQAQNTSAAVVAVSQQQDAIIQLTLAQGDPVTAARTFLSQQGVQAGRTFQQPINGVPAAGSYFQAQTEQGTIQGIVSYFSYGGQTYQLLSYAPAGRLEQYDAVFQHTVASFSPLTDPQLLNVQPRRVDVVTIERPMTLAEFAQRYPSAVPIEEIARINQLPDTNAQLPAGALVKRVIES